ncbi:MAG: MFS transporter [Pseudonocardiaceae bacterium]
MFIIDIAAFVVLGVAQGLVTSPWQLFIARLLLGVAIGAEYAIGAAMLAEFAPSTGTSAGRPTSTTRNMVRRGPVSGGGSCSPRS